VGAKPEPRSITADERTTDRTDCAGFAQRPVCWDRGRLARLLTRLLPAGVSPAART